MFGGQSVGGKSDVRERLLATTDVAQLARDTGVTIVRFEKFIEALRLATTHPARAEPGWGLALESTVLAAVCRRSEGPHDWYAFLSALQAHVPIFEAEGDLTLASWCDEQWEKLLQGSGTDPTRVPTHTRANNPNLTHGPITIHTHTVTNTHTLSHGHTLSHTITHTHARAPTRANTRSHTRLQAPILQSLKPVDMLRSTQTR